MSVAEADRVLVVLSVVPGLEEPVVDWLMERDGDTGFTSVPAFGHGADAEGLSIAEQVTGRRRRLRFEIAMPRAQCRSFLDEAVARFGTADIHVMVLPILAAGDPATVRDAFSNSG